jgi:hypothetical protein
MADAEAEGGSLASDPLAKGTIPFPSLPYEAGDEAKAAIL